jgi:ubiquinone/menaquinone biosynthesis C-methylase UbiE
MRKAMTRQISSEAFGTAPENYERIFVPAIGRPVAEDLIAAANLQPGERVLDVACGTGVIAKLALAAVTPSRRVAGLDVNPGMLAVAQKETPSDAGIKWHEASAESMPLQD